ncbi:MAG: SgcJ/EcaC family oxidoreductase [Hamadaea sp.]|uniref:SgcJ/EcaC family oxidoreductase n=1 Tax=Hamadaea sp. TaxID=2024425 RepID=UPI00180FF075|nr:SgcJ/EcaC family oxidoreductase [Hamadaea sp.]NUR72354.1 SgcJ/EcaC family oxidoreductase [Hamadaea sp.]NUT20255.1 SgcJ/EcaC family oxidoreductase [Hamadaea sp.]
MSLVEDEDAIRAVFDTVASAWAAGDAEAFAEAYAENATAILPGYFLPGKATITESMAGAFAGPLHGSKRVHTLQSLRFIQADVAIVISRSSTDFPGGAGPISLVTWVLAKQDGRWRIEAYHDCPAAEPTLRGDAR